MTALTVAASAGMPYVLAGMEDLYDLLGVRPSASAEELRRAYRARARQWHPDRPGAPIDASELMARLNAAWRVLSDPRRRAEYDGLVLPPPLQRHESPVTVVSQRYTRPSRITPVLRVLSAFALVMSMPALGIGFVGGNEVLQRLAVLLIAAGILGVTLVYFSVLRSR